MTQQKTNKSQGGLKIPRFIINTGKMLQFFSPDLATKYVRYLFQKPIRHKMPEAEIPWKEKAEIFFLTVPEINKKIAVYKWGNSNRKALVVHGWSGRATQMFKIIEALLQQGYTVYSFDAPAHGQSTGNKTMMPEFIKTIEKVAETYGPFEVAIGHSMGGIALLNVEANNALFQKLVVIGAPDSIFNIFNEFVEKLELKPVVAQKLIAVFERISGKSIFDFHGSTQTKKIKAPVLIIHDENDKEVPITDAINNFQQLENGQILQTRGLGHSRILKNKKVVNRIIDFIK